jgi:peptidoglycan hydrolase-like protein with peptidoglycan-binding domain
MALKAPRFVRNVRLQKASNNAPALMQGETSLGVKDLQQAFLDLGYKMPKSTGGGHWPPDAAFGAETRSVAIQFQKDHGLVPDGVVGKQTMTRLDQIFSASDSDYRDPLRDRLELLQEMNGPEGSRPFGASTARKN